MDIYDIVDNPEKQLEVFSGIIKRMNASSDHDETLVTIISEIKTIMYTDSILLYLVDQELYNLHYEMSIGPLGSKFFGNIIDSERPLAVRAYTTSCSLYSNDPQEDSAFIPMKEVLGEELKNILFVPLKVRKKNIGSLFLINKKNGKFIEQDTVVMSLFANIVSLALVNKMVYDRAQSRAYEVGALYQMSISINKCETIEEILNDNISIVCEAFEVHRVSVILKENGVFKFKAGIGIDENVLKYGGYILLDEIEDHFNKTIVMNIIELFMKKATNPNDAHLVFTTHYQELLDILPRNDSVYITTRNNELNLVVKNLAEFLKRNDMKKSDILFSDYYDLGTAVDYESYLSLLQNVESFVSSKEYS